MRDKVYFKTKLERQLAEEFGYISLAKFIAIFFPSYGKDLTKITHMEAYNSFETLEFFPLQMLTKKDENGECYSSLVYNGKVILVSDGHSLMAYIAPQMLCEDIEQVEISEDEDRHKIRTKLEHCEDLSEYELIMCLRRKFNTSEVQVKARRELNNRNIPITLKYRRSDYKKIIEED